MMELNKQHLFTIRNEYCGEEFVIKVVDDIVTLQKDDGEMVFCDVEDAIEAIGLIHKALKEIRNGD
jgi:hypothetical protein